MHIKQYLPKFLRACPDPFRGEVLEVGAGRGWTSQQILETFPQVELTATDITIADDAHWRRIQSKYGERLKIQQADVLHLPFDRASFDIVIAVHVLHHVDDIRLATRQLLRVLRPGGLLGIGEMNRQDISGLLSWLWHGNVIPRETLEQLLRDEDCEILVSHSGTPYTIWARKPYPVTTSDKTLT